MAKLILAFITLFSIQTFAKDWSAEPVANTPPTCVAFFAINFPGDSDPHSALNQHVKQALKAKGFVPHYEAPCDPGPGTCYGASSYLELRGFIGRNRSGDRNVQLNVFHTHYRPVYGGAEALEVGIYFHESTPIMFDRNSNMNALLQMVNDIPSCKNLKLSKHRRGCTTKECFGDLIPAAP